MTASMNKVDRKVFMELRRGAVAAYSTRPWARADDGATVCRSCGGDGCQPCDWTGETDA